MFLQRFGCLLTIELALLAPLRRRIQLEIGKHGRPGEASQFAAIAKRLQDALLDILVARGNSLNFLAQRNRILHGLVDV
jgi:hypothetical protein